jgi:hypothetical protein
MKTTAFRANGVKLIVDNLEIEQLAASASISLNPNVTWLKLILTDDEFNANKQRIPREEFANVLRTGAFMPLKMALREISEGHENTYPLGTMAHLKTEGNSIQALAALWNRERQADVDYIKDRYKNGESIDISWEVTYSEDQEEDGGVALRGVAMNAATIVGLPAYEGRTTVIAMSSSSQENITGDSKNMDTIELAEHQRLLDEQKSQFETSLQELQNKLNATQAELDDLKPKFEDLANFKAGIEKEHDNEERLASIKTKFLEAGLTVSEEYFAERKDSFLAMSAEQVDFLLQELLAAFEKPEVPSEQASISITSKRKIPNLNLTKTDINTEDIIKYLRNSK